MTDAIIVGVMLSALVAYPLAFAYGAKRAGEKLDRLAAERQAQRDRDMDLLREGVEWAMAMTPPDWVKS